MGENTTRGRARTTPRARATKDEIRDAEAVLARSVMQPRMDAIAALAVAAKAAADPNQIRQDARQRADQLAERAQQRGQELRKAARQKAKELLEEAARQRRELTTQVEVDIQTRFEQWQATYRAARAAGWTEEQLAEVGWPPPPSRLPRRARRRRTPADAAASAAPDTVGPAKPDESAANVPA